VLSQEVEKILRLVEGSIETHKVSSRHVHLDAVVLDDWTDADGKRRSCMMLTVNRERKSKERLNKRIY
jgi:hypothetical protein